MSLPALTCNFFFNLTNTSLSFRNAFGHPIEGGRPVPKESAEKEEKKWQIWC